MSAFDKIIGYESVKEKLRSYSDCLNNPAKYKRIGAKVPTGIMLFGDPGLGKTLMAKCMMEESKRKTYIIRKTSSDGDFINAMKNTVIEASQNAPSIVLLDDLDKYANEDKIHRDAEEYVAIQALIDEYASAGVFFIATVNDKNALPDSLVRAGRFDSQIQIGYPSVADSNRIMEYYLSQQKLAKDVDKEFIARMMCGYSCATLANIINEAGLHAAYQGKKRVDQDAFNYACLKELYRDDALVPEELSEEEWDDMRSTAVHEVGHALIAEVLEPGSVTLITILRSDYRSIKGITSRRYKDGARTREDVEKQILINLGGKAATEVVLGELDLGSKSDVRSASYYISELVEDCNQFGFRSGWDRYSSSAWCETNSDKYTAHEFERYYQLSKRIISQNRVFFDAMVKELEEKKLLTFRDIARIRETSVEL